MREATYPVNTDLLQALTGIHPSVEIARKLNITKQVWHHYKTGSRDMPESVVERFCVVFAIPRDRLLRVSVRRTESASKALTVVN